MSNDTVTPVFIIVRVRSASNHINRSCTKFLNFNVSYACHVCEERVQRTV